MDENELLDSDLDSLSGMLAEGLDPDCCVLGYPLVLIKVERGQEDCALALLEAGAATKLAGSLDEGVLMRAATRRGAAQIVRLLLERGERPMPCPEKAEPTPLYTAAANGSTELVELLLEHGAPVDEGSYANETALMAASGRGHTAIAARLLDAGADIDRRSSSGLTPLMHTAEGAHVDVARLLIDRGADIHAKDESGRNATDIVRECFDPVVAQAFRDLGVPDLYSLPPISDGDTVDHLYDVFLSYRHREHMSDVDDLRREFIDAGKRVFVDRFELGIGESLHDEKLKAMLRQAIAKSATLILFEMDPGRYSGRRMVWPYFEILQAADVLLISTQQRICSRIIIKPPRRMQAKSLFSFADFKDFVTQLDRLT